MSMYRRKLMIANALKRSDGNINYPGLIAAWSAKGKTNDDADRAILKDLTGNGHDITLNNFAYSGMSGYGGYNINFLTFGNTSSNLKEKTSTKIIVNGRVNGYICYKHPKTEVPSFKIKISGLVTDYAYVDENNIRQVIRIKEGEHILPKSYASDTITTTCGFMNPITSESTENGIIELLPEYPDALVFDGVDDYGINKDMPILTDYTIIAKRKHNSSKKKKTETFISKTISWITGEFVLELATPTVTMAYSFGEYTTIKYQNNITYQTKVSYNGKVINVGMTDGGKVFNIGKRNTETDFYTGAFYSAYLFDRSLDEQEIKAFIRKYIDPEYILPSEIPTPDCYYDFSQGSNDDETRDTIKDLSGNGNDAVAHNFAWSGMSGYGGYNINFLTFGNTSSNLKEKTSTKIIVNGRVNGYICYKHPKTEVPSFKIKISGLVTDYAYVDENNIRQVIRIKEGEHILPKSYASDTITTTCGFMNPITSESTENGIIELLPEYPDALVFDGTDDYIALDAFDSGFKTVFMLCNPLSIKGGGEFLYDQRKSNFGTDNSNYAIFTNGGHHVAYSERNKYDTFINGMLNSSVKVGELVNKKQLIHILANGEIQNGRPMIGANNNGSSYYSTMALYKFLGFKEALTEEQIKAVINKYNLLDGVDNIDVN